MGLDLFKEDLHVINLGLESFARALKHAGAHAIHVDWRPRAGGDPALLAALDALCTVDGTLNPRIVAANQVAVERLLAAAPRLVGLGRAADVIPGMHADLMLHAGPPVTWEQMSGPTRGAVIGGLILEGRAQTAAEANALAAAGRISFSPCHHHQAVGPMAGVVTASMPVWIVENATFGSRAYCTLNEGLGRVLRYGAYDPSVIERLEWMRDTLAPVLAETIVRTGPIDLARLIAQALQMGDEGHNRNRAATSLFIRVLAPQLVHASQGTLAVEQVLRFIDGNDHFFLNLSMPACKCALDPAANIPASTLVTAMARNGTEFGIQVSGLGNRWFTAPAPMVDGLYLPGFSAADAAPDIGDSVITETAGLGGFAMAAAPAIVGFVGGRAADAVRFTQAMYDITLAEHPAYRIPALDFRGTPTGIELTRVVESGVVPVVNTGIAHKTPGIGMVGAGLVKPPLSCFAQALTAFHEAFSRGI